MIIYNVTIKVETGTADTWVQWMKNEHLSDVLGTGLFFDCKLCKLLEQDEAEGITYVAQYYCNNIEQYNEYISKHAEIMRAKGLKLFAGKFVAFRTVMETIE